MASITRTAYPQLKVAFSVSELQALYQPSSKELEFVRINARKQGNRITLLVLLKCHKSLGYFPDLGKIPDQLKTFLAEQLDIAEDFALSQSKRTIYRYYQLIRSYLKIKSIDKKGTNQIEALIRKSAYTMSDPADLINVALEELVRLKYELPAFETLDRWVSRIREEVHQILYTQITASLSDEQIDQLEAMLQLKDEERLTDFTLLKQVPGKPTLSQMKLWIEKLDWIQTFPPATSFVKDISHTKIRQFAAEAYGLEVGDMKDIVNKSKCHSLLLCRANASNLN